MRPKFLEGLLNSIPTYCNTQQQLLLNALKNFNSLVSEKYTRNVVFFWSGILKSLPFHVKSDLSLSKPTRRSTYLWYFQILLDFCYRGSRSLYFFYQWWWTRKMGFPEIFINLTLFLIFLIAFGLSINLMSHLKECRGVWNQTYALEKKMEKSESLLSYLQIFNRESTFHRLFTSMNFMVLTRRIWKYFQENQNQILGFDGKLSRSRIVRHPCHSPD